MKLLIVFLTSVLVVSVVAFLVFQEFIQNEAIDPGSTTNNRQPSKMDKIGKEKTVWKIERINSQLKGITAIFFLDSQNGWVAGTDSFFKINDLGQVIEKYRMPLRPNETVANINFFDLVNGWIIVRKSIELTANSSENEFRILTTKDAGKAWQESLVVKGGEFVSLSNERDGQILLTGVKHEASTAICYNPILLAFDKNKSAWNSDNSYAESRSYNKNTNIKECLNEAVMGSLLTDDTVFIINGNKMIYEKVKGDYGWNKFAEYKIFDEQSGVKKFGVKDNRQLWFLESTRGDEGTRGRLVTVSPDGESRDFTQSGLFYLDAAYISDGEFLICGSKITHSIDKKSGSYVKSSTGIILATDDDGKTLVEIYNNPEEEEIVYLHKVETNNVVWALGEKGNVYRLTGI